MFPKPTFKLGAYDAFGVCINMCLARCGLVVRLFFNADWRLEMGLEMGMGTVEDTQGLFKVPKRHSKGRELQKLLGHYVVFWLNTDPEEVCTP